MLYKTSFWVPVLCTYSRFAHWTWILSWLLDHAILSRLAPTVSIGGIKHCLDVTDFKTTSVRHSTHRNIAYNVYKTSSQIKRTGLFRKSLSSWSEWTSLEIVWPSRLLKSPWGAHVSHNHRIQLNPRCPNILSVPQTTWTSVFTIN